MPYQFSQFVISRKLLKLSFRLLENARDIIHQNLQPAQSVFVYQYHQNNQEQNINGNGADHGISSRAILASIALG